MSESPHSTHHANRSIESHFRHSDHVPSDTERSHLEAIVREETGNIQRRDEEIIILEQKLANIRMENLASKDTISICHSALSVHRRVPPEIWEIIFSSVCHPYSLQIDIDDTSDDFDNAECIAEAPALVLSRICSRWRKIMKGAPFLWSSISVEFGRSFSEISTVIDTYITNAGECPLDMHIVGGPDEPPFGCPDANAWATLSRHFNRCGTLTLAFEFLSDLESIDDLSFPHLKFLCEETESGEDAIESLWFWQAVQLKATNLTRVVLWSFSVFLPFSQITSLDIQMVHADEIQHIHEKLPLFPRLEELILRQLNSWSEHEELPTQLNFARLGSLRKLCINHEGPSFIPEDPPLSPFLKWTLMPSLTSLELRCRDWPQSLATLVERSPLLERVSLTLRVPGTADFSSHPLFAFLQSLSKLKHVELDMGMPELPRRLKPFGDDFIAVIFAKLRTSPERPVFPRLESLSLRLADLTLSAEVVERVLRVVSERRSLSSTLTEFRVLRTVPNGTDVSDDSFVLDPELTGKVRDLERNFGVRVVVEDVMSESEDDM